MLAERNVDCMITVLTPTYNRVHTLPALFDSLCRQSDTNFEWIVVDDGSVDGTEEQIQKWISQSRPFPLSYYKRENGGKHRAVNFGVQNAAGDFVLILDSDDYLSDDAIAYANQWIETVKNDEKFAGVSGKRFWSAQIMSKFNQEDDDSFIDATNLERDRYHIYCDQAEIYKTDILKQFPFPEYEGECFIRESSAWDRIALAGYKLRWFNRSIYYSDYQSDGLTKNVDSQVYVKNWKGFTDCTVLFLKTHSIPYTWIKIGYYAEVAKLAQRQSCEICENLQITWIELLLAKMFYQVNRIRKRFSSQFDPRGV